MKVRTINLSRCSKVGKIYTRTLPGHYMGLNLIYPIKNGKISTTNFVHLRSALHSDVYLDNLPMEWHWCLIFPEKKQDVSKRYTLDCFLTWLHGGITLLTWYAQESH